MCEKVKYKEINNSTQNTLGTLHAGNHVWNWMSLDISYAM